MRVAVVAFHPIQYQAPLFRALAKVVDLRVFFCWDFGTAPRFEPKFGRTVQWDVPLLDGYDSEFLRIRAPERTTHSALGPSNPDVAQRVKAFHPDAVVVHGYTQSTMLRVITACAGRIPMVVRGEGILLRPATRFRRAIKGMTLPYLLKSFSAFAAIGSRDREFYEHYGVPSRKIFVAPYAVDNDFFQERADAARIAAADVRSRLAIPRDHVVFLFAAKLVEKKGCEELVRAFARMHGGRSTLVIVGDGPLRPSLESIARSSDAPVHFLGFYNQSEMPAAYAIGDVFVLPSRIEPWGLAVNEAMNMALPVIASDQVGSVPDLVAAENGWVHAARDVDALAAAMKKALDAGNLAAMGQSSLRRISRWGIPQTVEGFMAALEYATRRKTSLVLNGVAPR